MNRITQLSLASTLALMTGSTVARGDLITALSAPPVAVAGGYAYTYNVSLAGQSQLIGTNTAAGNGTVAGINEFGTINDFGPIVTGAGGAPELSTTGLLSSDFTFSFDNSDTPPANTIPPDSPLVANIRFTYDPTYTLVYVDPMGGKVVVPTGTTTEVEVEPGATNLGTFTVVSPYGPPVDSGLYYDGVSYKSTNNSQQQNVGELSGPAVPVPEPAGAALLCVGLGLIRRRTRRAAVSR